jgi:WD40 repeat protein/DNA-binding SARP family transcriptional activator/tRNA A-37 threonylcarbamoyl transferase component Bud32
MEQRLDAVMYRPDVDFTVLGPVGAMDGGDPVRVGGPKQRTVLALLLAEAGRSVPDDVLIQGVWGDEAAPGARGTLQTYVFNLRAELGDLLTREGDGYRLAVERDRVDALRFEDALSASGPLVAGDPAAAAASLREALALWRGHPFADLPGSERLEAEARRLEELRLRAVEQRIDAELALGLHAELIAELEVLCTEYPLSERFRAQHMLALYRSGRQAEALRAYQKTRGYLAEELGIDPSAELRNLEQRILDQDPALHLEQPGRPQGATIAKSARGYELREMVAESSAAAVYRGYQHSVGREVAVKLIRPDLADRGDFIRRFEAEAQLVAGLEHPHIVPLYDYWRDPEGACLVMRFMRGGSLSQALTRGPWNPAPATRLLSEIGSALVYAHRRGVLHGDIKPSNVLLDEEGGAYLSDFGMGPDPGPADITPEEATGRPPSPRSDVYGLGLLAFELLTARRPPPDAPLPGLGRLRPGLPAGFDEVVARATAPDPDDRFATVEGFLRALGAAVGTPLVVEAPFTPTRNPYKGLHPFTEADAADFFGRAQLVDELIAAMAQRRLVAVVGPSGIGKSSVVRAGLVPALRSGALAGSDQWLITDMVPGADPFEEMASALLRVAAHRPADLAAQLTADPEGVIALLGDMLPPGSRLLVVVDQFEELFTHTTDEGTRRRFLALIESLTPNPHSPARVVLTMRADFLDRPLRYPGFGDLLGDGLVTVSSPSEEELAAAIRRPAEAVGVAFQPGLVEQILADVADQSGALPLLQYALTELFAQRSGDLLTLADYQSSGGVLGALGRRADELYGQLDHQGQTATRQVFLRLVTVDEAAQDTRRRVPKRELRGIGVDPPILEEVLRRYGEYRLLSFDRHPLTRSPTVEVAHEALLNRWNRLRGWIDERREDLLLHRRLAESVEEWDRASREPSYLLGGGRLEQFEALAAETDLALSGDERDYLTASRADEDKRNAHRRRRRRGILTGFGAAAFISLILAGLAYLNQQQAEKSEAAALANEQRAETESVRAEAEAVRAGDAEQLAAAREMAASAISVLDEDPELSILLALEATKTADPPPEAVKALHQAVQASRSVFSANVDHPPEVLGIGVAMSPDGKTVATSGDGRTVEIWDVDRGILLQTLGQSREEEVARQYVNLAMTGDGEHVATVDTDGVAHIWNVASGTEVTFQVPGRGLGWVAFSPDGKRLAVVTDQGIEEPIVTFWDWRHRRRTGNLWQIPSVESTFAFHPNGRQLLFASNSPFVLDIDSGRQTWIEQDAVMGNGDFSPDGKWIAAGGNDSEAHIWNASTGREIRAFQGHSSALTGTWFSPDGSRLATLSFDGTVRIWNVYTGATIMTLAGQPGTLVEADFSADWKRMVTGTAEGFRVWDLSKERPGEVAGFDLGDVSLYGLDQNGDLLAALGRPCLDCIGTVTVLDTASGRTMELPDQAGTFPGVAFTPDGSAVVSQDGYRGEGDTLERLGPIRVRRLWSGDVATELQGICDERELRPGELDPGCSYSFEGDAADPPFWEIAREISFSADGRLMALTGASGAISLWAPQTGRLVELGPWSQEDYFRESHLSPDGTLVAALNDTSIDVLAVPGLEQMARLPIDDYTGGYIGQGMGFSPDGLLFGADKYIVDTSDWSIRHRLAVDNIGSVVDFSGDSDRYLMVDGEGFVRVWDVGTGEELHTVPHGDRLAWAARFMDDPDHIAVARDNGTILIFTTDLDELSELARDRVTRSLTDEECQTYLHGPCPED